MPSLAIVLLQFSQFLHGKKIHNGNLQKYFLFILVFCDFELLFTFFSSLLIYQVKQS